MCKKMNFQGRFDSKSFITMFAFVIYINLKTKNTKKNQHFNYVKTKYNHDINMISKYIFCIIQLKWLVIFDYLNKKKKVEDWHVDYSVLVEKK